MAVIVEGVVDLATEDGGMALISENIEHNPGADNGMFVRLQSWDETKQHSLLRSYAGRKVRVTIEVID